jgi:putative ABC transport system permease protein
MDRWLLDLKSAWRSLAAQRAAMLVLVAVIGLGIGLVSTMFAMADPFVTRPLPYPSSHELVRISVFARPGRNPFSYSSRANLPTLGDWKARSELFQAIAPSSVPTTPALFRVRAGDRTIALRPAEATPAALRILGQSPAACADAPRCVLLTAAAFARHFGSRREIVGTALPTPAGEPMRIGGVFPPSFVFPWPGTLPVEAVVVTPEAGEEERPVAPMTFLARLQRGVPASTLQSALVATLPVPQDWTLTVERIDEFMTRLTRPAAVGALVAALIILLVCAASVTNLLFARTFYRAPDLTTRRALGAARLDIVRLLVTELAILATMAIGTGLLIAHLTLLWLAQVMPARYMILGAPAITPRVASAAAFVGVAIVVLSASMAWLASRRSLNATTGTLAPRQSSAGRALRFFVITAQCGLAMLLVTSSIVFGRSYLNLFRQDTGFSGSATVIAVSYPGDLSEQTTSRHVMTTVEELGRVAGVESAAAAFLGVVRNIRPAGPPIWANGKPIQSTPRPVTEGFFSATGTPIVAGRPLMAEDANYRGFVVSESFARLAWSDRTAIGQTIQISPGLPPGTVVGIVRDTMDLSLDRRAEPRLYRLFGEIGSCPGCERSVSFVVRTTQDALAVADRAVRTMTKVSPDVAILDIGSIDERLSQSVAERVFVALVVSLFTIAGLAVCVAGLIGTVVFITASRTRELAIRIAVGARPAHVFAAVSTDTLLAATLGISAGLVTARFTSAVLASMAYEVELNTWATGLPPALVMLTVVSATVLVAARPALTLSVIDSLHRE